MGLLHGRALGLIDLAEYVAGEDAALGGNALYAARLRDVVEAIQPRALAFTERPRRACSMVEGRIGSAMGASQSALVRLPLTCCLPLRRIAPSGLLSLTRERAAKRHGLNVTITPPHNTHDGAPFPASARWQRASVQRRYKAWFRFPVMALFIR
jgi:hypothetical protein